MEIKAVIFDMDGVLVDTEPVYCEQLAAYLDQAGGCSDFELIKQSIGASGQEYLDVLQKVKPEAMAMDAFREGYRRYYRQHPIDYPKIAEPGLQPFLKGLRDRGLKLAVASSSRMEQIQAVLCSCGITECFDEVVSGEMFEKSKPDPSIYLEVLKRLGVPAEATAVVEDSVYGICSARAAGVGLIFQKWNAWYPMPTEEGCIRIEHLSEICYSLFGG